MIKVGTVVASGAMGRGICRLLEADGDIRVVVSADALSELDVPTCKSEGAVVVVGPDIPFDGVPATWSGIDVILVTASPSPGRFPDVTEVPMELTGAKLRTAIRHLVDPPH